MKDLVKYIVIGVVIYLAYKYYMENFSKKGKVDIAVTQSTQLANVEQLANQLKEEARAKTYASCLSVSKSAPSFPPNIGEQIYATCTASAQLRLDNTDWIALAREQLGY